MTANGSAGNRDGFEAWVQALQRPPGAGQKQSDPDLASALVDGNATQVQQIPKELIHRLREREQQGLLGVETERTAVFKPPPELLARAKRMQQVAKGTPSQAPAAEKSDMPTAPPPEAAVPTVKPPPPSKVESFDDDWLQVESGLDALKPIERSVPAPAARPSRPLAPAFTSAAPASRPGAAVVVAKTVAVVKAEASSVRPVPAAPAAPDFDMDEPTRIRGDAMHALLGPPIQAPTEDLVVERTEPRAQEVAAHVKTLPEAFPAFHAPVADAAAPATPHVDAPVPLPAYDSMAPAALERSASGRRWVVIAAVFLSLVVIALAALRH